MGKPELPQVLTRENYQQFVDAHTDPDAERFRYFGAAMMSSIGGLGETAQAATLRQVIDLHKPRTLDELRVCIDAAKVLTP